MSTYRIMVTFRKQQAPHIIKQGGLSDDSAAVKWLDFINRGLREVAGADQVVRSVILFAPDAREVARR